jgi:hypothetical protein
MYAPIPGRESMHAWMGNLSQCMPEYGEGFCKILLALWATWFIVFLCNHFCSAFSRWICLTSIWHLLYSCHCMAGTSLMALFQGQGRSWRSYYGKSRLSTKPFAGMLRLVSEILPRMKSAKQCDVTVEICISQNYAFQTSCLFSYIFFVYRLTFIATMI